MNIPMGEIVTIISNAGEFVGKLVSAPDRGQVALEDPRFVVFNNENGQMSFAQGVAMTGEAEPKQVTFYGVCLVVKTNPEVVTIYKKAVSKLITRPEPKIIV